LEEHDRFTLSEITRIDDVRRVPFQLWNGKWCWVWGVTERQYIALRCEARRTTENGDWYFDEERYVLCRFIECVRDSGEAGAKPIFNRKDHYEWLANRSMEVIERAVELSMRLSGELPLAEGATPPFPGGKAEAWSES